MSDAAKAQEPEALRAALTYAARGWPVAPAFTITASGACSCGDAKCTSKGKHPIGSLVPNGLKNASTDPETIRAWWEKEPSANVLIRTGMVGDRCLVALDIDPRHNGDESLAELIVKHGDLPATPMCCTGGGGQHIFMWSHKAIPNSAGRAGDGRFGEGVDVRGEGGYVIAAPSRHESGRAYEWDSGAHPADLPLAEAPPWFVHLAGWSKKRREAADGADVGASETYIIGGRNDALMRLAGAMRRVGAGLKRITDALLDENEEKCNPPLDPAEVRKIARSAHKYPAGDPSTPGVDPYEMLSAADMATELPPTPWVCEALGIAPGAVTIVGGAGYGGKTISMQALALAVASGMPLWGEFAIARGKAVHLDYEQGRPLTQRRYQRIANAMGLNWTKLQDTFAVACLPKGKLSDPEAEEHLVRICTGAKVCIVDSFRRAFPKAKENDSEASAYLDMVQKASERTGCAMIVIMHTRKSGEDKDLRNSLRGSAALFDAAQTVYMLNGTIGKPTQVVNLKDRILGDTRDMFGLRVSDVALHGDSRWGLSVTHVGTADMQSLYVAEEDDIAAGIERVASLGKRVLALLTTAGGVDTAMIRASTKANANDLAAAIQELERQGLVETEGKGGKAWVTLR